MGDRRPTTDGEKGLPKWPNVLIDMNIEEVLKEAEDRIQFGYDICNGEPTTANQFETGFYIAYWYNHSEEEMWSFVTFDDKEKARMLAEYWASEYCTEDSEKRYMENAEFDIEQGYCTREEAEDEMKSQFAEFDEKAAWDLPYRIGEDKSYPTTVGYCSVYDLINCMPLKVLRQFISQIFECSIITGFQEDH